MNCLEFRRRCLSDPYSRDPEYLAHRRECMTCATYAAEQAAFNRRLAAAMQVAVPRRLGAETILNQRLRNHRQRHVLAVAASLIGALGLFLALQMEPDGARLEDTLAKHIDHDPIHERPPAAWRNRQLTQLVAELGGTVEGSIPGVKHVVYCPINEKGGVHLTLEGRHGPVVVFLLPRHSIGEARQVLAGQLNGWITPAEKGVIALYGQPGETLQEHGRALSRRISWSG